MKLPRDLSSAQLEKSLRRTFGYEFTRQVGSHRRVTTPIRGQHHLTIPQHDPIRVGTLRTIFGEIMEHHALTLEQLLVKLGYR
jgi:predicted RNA binding protein YcfA (HicA-like mRNA interferase family)